MPREPEAQNQQVIRVIHKGPKREIRISLSTFRGRTFGDLRLYVINRQGQLVATPKGITLPVEQLEELEKAVLKLRNAAEQSTHPF